MVADSITLWGPASVVRSGINPEQRRVSNASLSIYILSIYIYLIYIYISSIYHLSIYPIIYLYISSIYHLSIYPIIYLYLFYPIIYLYLIYLYLSIKAKICIRCYSLHCSHWATTIKYIFPHMLYIEGTSRKQLQLTHI